MLWPLVTFHIAQSDAKASEINSGRPNRARPKAPASRLLGIGNGGDDLDSLCRLPTTLIVWFGGGGDFRHAAPY